MTFLICPRIIYRKIDDEKEEGAFNWKMSTYLLFLLFHLADIMVSRQFKSQNQIRIDTVSDSPRVSYCMSLSVYHTEKIMFTFYANQRFL